MRPEEFHIPSRVDRKANETRDLVHPIRKALNKLPGVRVLRNNTGSLEWDAGKRIVYGLGKGSPDLVGSVMVACCSPPVSTHQGPVFQAISVGRVFVLEVKRKGRKPTYEQLAWLAVARKFGCFACIIEAVDTNDAIKQAREAVARCLMWMNQ